MRFSTCLSFALGALAVAVAQPAVALGAAAAPLPALAPGQVSCPAATGPLGAAALSGDAGRGLWLAPVLLPSGVMAYLQSARHPTPHIAAVAAQSATGRLLWRLPLRGSAAPTALSVAGRDLVVAERGRKGVAVVRINPATGAAVGARSLPWPLAPVGPALTPDGRGGVLVSGAVANLPTALSGLGSEPTPVWDVAADGSVRWHTPSVGDVVAVVGGTAMAAVRDGAGGSDVVLTALDTATGAELWQATLPLGFAPRTAAFAAAGSILVWAFTGPGGSGTAGAIGAADGAPLWQTATRLPLWLGDGAWVVAGAPPWDRPAAFAVRSAATGRLLWVGGASTPVALLGGRILTETTAGWQWWPLRAHRPAVQAADPRLPTEPPPLSVYCGGAGASLLGPWRAGEVWTVATGPATAAAKSASRTG